jgi:hypothetical protein
MRIEQIMTKQELERSLRDFPGIDTNAVVIAGDARFVAQIRVPSFAGVDEADRQAQVYDFLRQRFPVGELQDIEYIIITAPGDDS